MQKTSQGNKHFSAQSDIISNNTTQHHAHGKDIKQELFFDSNSHKNRS